MTSASRRLHPEYQYRLPLPLAQLYARAYNAKDARGRHDNGFYLFETLTKLAAAPMVACYLSEVDAGVPRVAGLDRLLEHLALPSLGQWAGIVRQLARYFGTRAGATEHPLGHVWGQLSDRRDDLPGLLELYRQINSAPDGQPCEDASCSILLTLEALVRYRNQVFGQGGQEFDAFYDSDLGPLLLPAADELLGEGVFDFLGPPGSRLVYITKLRETDDARVEIGMQKLFGVAAVPSDPLLFDKNDAAKLAADIVAVVWPGSQTPLRLDPLLIYREGELAEEVLFLNRGPQGTRPEYLSYTTGRTERGDEIMPALAGLLSRIRNAVVDANKLTTLAEQTVLAPPGAGTAIPATPVPTHLLGDYELVAEIGRGGMGVVYLARQMSLGRLVALKMLPGDLAGDEMALTRFRREMRVLARCEHRNIVRVLSSGVMPDGRMFYAMEYVAGCDLEEVWRVLSKEHQSAAGGTSMLGDTAFVRAVITASRRKREQTDNNRAHTTTLLHAAGEGVSPLQLPALPEMPSAEGDPGGYVRRVVSLIRDAALGLQAMHEQGVVHRDIKPSNLMLTADGSRVVLMDFGLAKIQGLDLTLSRAGGFMGTLRYASPEQLAAESQPIGPAADVRGLGVVLWELLTRRRLFAEAADEFLLSTLIHERDVPPLRTIDSSFDAELESIVARATERRISNRIDSAGKFAEHLQLWLDRKELPIRPPSIAQRAWQGLKDAIGFAAARLSRITARQSR